MGVTLHVGFLRHIADARARNGVRETLAPDESFHHNRTEDQFLRPVWGAHLRAEG